MSLFTALKKLIKVELQKGDNVVFSFPQNKSGKVVVKRKIVKRRIDISHELVGAGLYPTIRRTIRLKGGEKMKGTPAVNECRELMDKVLNLLREELGKNTGNPLRSRELAIAITHMEEGCMRMIRSEHAEKPYSPLLRLVEDKPKEPAKPEVPAAPAEPQQPAEGTLKPAEPQAPANQPAQEPQPAQNAAEGTQASPAPADQPASQTPAEQPTV